MKASVPIILLILIAATVSAAETYNKTGTFDGKFFTDAGVFNDGNPQFALSISLKGLSAIKEVPLVVDMDNDGINEIIVMDAATLRLYHGSDLTIVDAYNTGHNERISNMLAFDIDGDGRTEVIFVQEESELIEIIDYNGTAITNTTLSIGSAITHIDGRFTIQCAATDQCLAVYHERMDSGAGADLRAIGFSSTTTGTEVDLSTGVATTENFCFPKVRSMPYTDFDPTNAGNEFLVNIMRFKNGGDERMFFFTISMTGLVVTETRETSTDNFGLGHGAFEVFDGGAPECDIDNLERFYSAPIVHNFDQAAGNGKEFVVASMVDSNEYIMGLFNSDHTFEDDFPETFEADGILVSNPFIANVFGDTGFNDFCVIGHQNVNQELEALCGTYSTGAELETIEFKSSTKGTFNITTAFGNIAIISHSGQHSDQQIATDSSVAATDTTEIISAYGVHRLSGQSFAPLSTINKMDRISALPANNLACIAVDAEKSGSSDLICHTGTTLYYLDDGLENQGALITNVNYNPCVLDGAILKQNTTLQIIVTVTDQNSAVLGQDAVGANVTIYKGTPNAVKQSVTGIASGDPIPLSFNANATGTNQIEIIAFDEGTSQTNTKTQSFTVASQGISFGQSTCSQVFEAVPDSVLFPQGVLTDPEGNQLNNNTINRGIVEYASLFGVSGSLVWILLMFILGITIILAPTVNSFRTGMQSGIGTNALLSILFIFEAFMLIIGSLLGILGLGIIVTLSVILIAALGIWFSRVFTGATA
jgi:hypothetical protein